MHYCFSCLRTLNGALVCPGCGAYAPDIEPPAADPGLVGTTLRPSWEASNAEASADREAGHGSRVSHAAAIGSEVSGDAGADAPDTQPVVAAEADMVSVAPIGQGRAARRRRMALWKKKRRRAAVVGAVALVGGGVTFGLLPHGPSGTSTQAALTPEPEALKTSTTDSARPLMAKAGTDVSRDDGTSAAPSRISSRPHRIVTARTAPVAVVTRSPQRRTAETSRAAATARPLTHATAPVKSKASTPNSSPVAPQPATAPSAVTDSRSNTDTSAVSAAPTTPTPASPVHICLLGLCLG